MPRKKVGVKVKKTQKKSWYQRNKEKKMREYNKQCKEVERLYAERWNRIGGAWEDAP